jgi:hypothetical protein
MRVEATRGYEKSWFVDGKRTEIRSVTIFSLVHVALFH